MKRPQWWALRVGTDASAATIGYWNSRSFELVIKEMFPEQVMVDFGQCVIAMSEHYRSPPRPGMVRIPPGEAFIKVVAREILPHVKEQGQEN